MNSGSLLSLLQGLGIASLRVRGHNVVGCCPIHNERRPSWGIRTDMPHVYGCFSCGAKGTLRSLLRHHYNWTTDAIDAVLGEEDLNDLRGTFPELAPKSLDLKFVHSVPPSELYPFSFTSEALAYVKKRGLTEKTALQANLLYDHSAHRLLYPWYVEDTLVGATGRAMQDGPGIPKIIAYFGLQKGAQLYMPGRTLYRQKELILVEGEFDALKVFQAGFRNVAAIAFGKFSKKCAIATVQELSPSELILFFDRDKVGYELTEEYVQLFSSSMKVSTVQYSSLLNKEGKADPGQLNSGLLNLLIRRRQVRDNWPSFSLE